MSKAFACSLSGQMPAVGPSLAGPCHQLTMGQGFGYVTRLCPSCLHKSQRKHRPMCRSAIVRDASSLSPEHPQLLRCALI